MAGRDRPEWTFLGSLPHLCLGSFAVWHMTLFGGVTSVDLALVDSHATSCPTWGASKVLRATGTRP